MQGKIPLAKLFILLIFFVAVFFLWWYPFIFSNKTPLNELGYSLIWGDWLSDKLFLVQKHIVPEWNPNYVLGVNYIGRDAFNNPLSLGNVFKFIIPDSKSEWLIGLFFYMGIMVFGMFVFLKSFDISDAPAMLGAVLFLLYPKFIEEMYHGPGKFVAAYSVLPWIMYTIRKMFKDKPVLPDFLLLGLLGAIVLCGSGGYVTLCLFYLIIPWITINLYWRISIINEDKILDFGKNIIGLTISLLIAVGLAGYLLLSLKDNLGSFARSVYGPAIGLGFKELVGLFFPWQPVLFTEGYYGLNVSFLGKIVPGIKTYMGILLIPLFMLIFSDKELRKKYIFFWLWPVILYFLFSNFSNKFFPVIRVFERILGASSSENFIFVVFIFCFNVFMVAALDKYFKKTTDEKCGLPKAAKVTGIILAIFYLVVIIAWISLWFLSRNSPGFFEKLASCGIFRGIDGYKNFMGMQLVFNSYFFDKFFFFYLAGFIARFIILSIFSISVIRNKKFAFLMISMLMILDFSLFHNTFYPFTSRMNEAYSANLAQNKFVNEKIQELDRSASFYPTEKIICKNKVFIENLKIRFPDKTWNPVEIASIYQKSNSDKSYFQPLFDPTQTCYPVTVGKAFYSYHESFQPEFFYDFDSVLNGNNERYSRSSWNAIWDPQSPLLDVSGIKYIFWYEPIIKKNMELVLRYPVGDGYIYRNNNAVSKAYLVGRIEYFDKRQDLLERMKQASFNSKDTVLTEDVELYDQFKAGGNVVGEAKVVVYEPNKINVKTKTDKRSVLIITDLFSPHWSAQVDNKPAKIYRVNCVFRGIVVENGEHEVRLIYRNTAFRKGLKISFGTFVAVIVFYIFWFIHFKKKKKLS